MDERMNHAPCGYLSLTEDHRIVTANETLLHALGYDLNGLQGCKIDAILTRSSAIFYNLYFFQVIKLNGKVEEMYLSLRSTSGADIPVLLNAIRRERESQIVYDCILVEMRRRIEYEQQISKTENAVLKANEKLRRIQRELELRQKELAELTRELDTIQQPSHEE